jgi:hypothetical protein
LYAFFLALASGCEAKYLAESDFPVDLPASLLRDDLAINKVSDYL